MEGAGDWAMNLKRPPSFPCRPSPLVGPVQDKNVWLTLRLDHADSCANRFEVKLRRLTGDDDHVTDIQYRLDGCVRPGRSIDEDDPFLSALLLDIAGQFVDRDGDEVHILSLPAEPCLCQALLGLVVLTFLLVEVQHNHRSITRPVCLDREVPQGRGLTCTTLAGR